MITRVFSARRRGPYLPPMVCVALAYSLGIAAQGGLDGPAWPAAVLSLLSLALALVFIRKAGASTCLLLAAFFFIGALRCEEASLLPARHIGRMTPAKGRWVRLEGVVVSQPKENRLFNSYILRVERGRDRQGRAVALTGDVGVCDHHKTPDVLGERLVIRGKLYRPRPPFAQALARRNIYSMLSVGRRGEIKKEARGLGSFSPILVRQRLAVVIRDHFDGVSASLLRAMMLGEKQLVPASVKKAMIAAGTWHIMVVSGFHTAFVAGIVFLFLKILRVPARPRLVLSMVAVIGYCLLTGAAVSVVRATVMTVVLLYTFIRERHPLFWHVLCLAAFAILLWDPAALFSISFQLSFMSVVSIVWLFPRLDPSPWLQKRWRPSHPAFAVLRPPLSWAAVSLSAWTGTAPLISATFGVISLYGVVANIVAAPLAMGIIGSGSLAVGLGLFSSRLAAPPAAACAFFLKAQVAWSSWIAGWPLAQVRLSLPGGWGLVAIYVLLALGLSRLSKRPAGKGGRGR